MFLHPEAALNNFRYHPYFQRAWLQEYNGNSNNWIRARILAILVCLAF